MSSYNRRRSRDRDPYKDRDSERTRDRIRVTRHSRSRSRSPRPRSDTGRERNHHTRREYDRTHDSYRDRRDRDRERGRGRDREYGRRWEEGRHRDLRNDHKHNSRLEINGLVKEDSHKGPSSIASEPSVTSREKEKIATPEIEEGQELEPMDDMDADGEAMAQMMGFGGFYTTKGKEVTGNQQGAALVKKQRTWRQYMNRRGGFNRPLDKIK